MMSAENESKSGSWLVYITVAGIVIPVLYAISWGPVGSLAANHAKLGEIAEAAYSPMSWLESNTQLSTPLGWYWQLFDSWRPQPRPAYFSGHDDLQYFPPGPEFKLSRQVQALEEYRLRQQEIVPTAEISSSDEERILPAEYQESESDDDADESAQGDVKQP